MSTNRRPSPHRQQVDLDTVRADDALLDALGQGDIVPGDEELARMLGAWRADLDTEPLPALDYDALPSAPADLDGDWAPGADQQTQVIPAIRQPRSRRVVSMRPRTVRLAAAAALVIAMAGGVSVASASARPNDALWPVMKIVHPQTATVREAQDAIEKARQAIAEHRYDDARQYIVKAETLVARVDDPAEAQRLRDELKALRGSLPAATPSTGSGRPSHHPTPSPTPSPTPGTGTSTSQSPGTNPTPSPSSSTPPGLLPILPSLLPGLLPSLLPHL